MECGKSARPKLADFVGRNWLLNQGIGGYKNPRSSQNTTTPRANPATREIVELPAVPDSPPGLQLIFTEIKQNSMTKFTLRNYLAFDEIPMQFREICAEESLN